MGKVSSYSHFRSLSNFNKLRNICTTFLVDVGSDFPSPFFNDISLSHAKSMNDSPC